MPEHAVVPSSTPGYDPHEPRTRVIAAFGLATLLLLGILILALQAYVDRVREQQIFVKQLEPVAEDLRALRAREDGELNSYRYVDRAKGVVRIPIRRAMELLVAEHGGQRAR